MKRTYIVCLLCCIILGASLAGCGAAAQTAPQSTVSSAVSEAPISEPAAAEEDVIIRAEEVGEFVTGLEDHIVVQDAKNINYLHDVAYDPSIVREVAQNDEAVDPSVPGTYRITYKVVIDKEAYRKFRNGEDVPASSEEASSRPAPTPLPDVKEPVVEDKGDVIEITIPKEIEIVDHERAKELADKGEIVWDTDNEILPKSDGSVTEEVVVVPPSAEETEEVASADSEAEVPKATATPAPTEKPKKEEAAKPTATPKPTATTKPAATATPKPTVKPTEAAKATPTPKPAATQKPTATPKPTATQKPTSKPTATPKPTSKPTATPKPAHVHSWSEVTKTVHHDEEGHYETVVVKKAWTEFVYDTQNWYVCNTCGEKFKNVKALHEHQDSTEYVNEDGYLDSHGGSSYITEDVLVDKIYHEEETEEKWVVDKKAWDETVVTGYVCDECGAKK